VYDAGVIAVDGLLENPVESERSPDFEQWQIFL
jgi:hypothetical protein